MRTIYLAGPINGCTDVEARGWRDAVKGELAGLYRFTDPMDDDFRGHEADNAAQIVRRDQARIRHAHIVLANAWRPSVGTPMEVAYAHKEGKHIIVVQPSPVSPWYEYHASHIAANLTSATSYLRARAA